MEIFQNSLKVIFRNLRRNKLYSIINITGLTTGLIVFILIFLFIRYEYSWDSFNKNYKNIHLVKRERIERGEMDISPRTPFALSSYLEANFPEIINSVKTKIIGGWYLSSNNENSFSEEIGMCTDPNLFDIFTIPILDGDKNSMLNKPMSVLLSKSLALKLFPHKKSIGEIVTIDRKYKVEVVGIYEDLPENSHFKPSYILPFTVLEKIKNNTLTNNWKSNGYKTYVLLNSNTEIKAINNKLINVLNDRFPDKKQDIFLSHISKVYLSPNNKDYLYALYAYRFISIFILILASINYINLATACSQQRIKEIGIKVIIGCSRKTIILQNIGEAVLFSIISVVFALILSRFILPVFSFLIHRDLIFTISDSWQFILFIIFIAIIVGILSGLYPAIVLSGYKPISIIKGSNFINIKGKIGLKRFLVGFQFIIFLILINISLVIKNQIRFMKDKDLGFDPTNIISTPILTENTERTIEYIKTRLFQIPEIENISISKSPPYTNADYMDMHIDDSQPEAEIEVAINYADIDFIDTYGLEIISGRSFNENNFTNSQTCIINETFAKKLNWDNPIDKSLENNTYKIIGVVKDFHQNSVHEKIGPYMILPIEGGVEGWNVYSIKLINGSNEKVLAKISKTFSDIFPIEPFEFKSFESKFLEDEAFEVWSGIGNAITFFTIFAVFIAAIGLFGLVSFTTVRRTKEIGIRKTLGCSNMSIYFLLSKEFIILFFFAILISVPISVLFYKTMPGAYKYNLQVLDLLIPLGIGLLITLLTTNNQMRKAANTNPVEALHYE